MFGMGVVMLTVRLVMVVVPGASIVSYSSLC
jgi:hypothetical protein